MSGLELDMFFFGVVADFEKSSPDGSFSANTGPGAAGFRPCLEPPIVPASCASCHDSWEIMMYKAGG